MTDVLEDQKSVITLQPNELDGDALLALAQGKVLVLHVSGFADQVTCKHISKMTEDHGYSPYLNAPTVDRIGMAFYETDGNQALVQEYFESAQKNMIDFRSACAPYLSPIDVLRCALDEAWPKGAQLQTLEGRKMFMGLPRMVRSSTTFLAHHDFFSDNAPDHIEATSLLAQFGANVHIQMPASGGALMLWKKEFTPTVFNEMRGEEYGIIPERLGIPDITVLPMPGDLLIFNARVMHAVSPGVGQDRLTLSCFVGYRGEAEPLTFWS